jgi:hypothetical protein
MKAGDLIIFRQCAQAGATGVITMATRPSYVAKANKELRLYWVLCDKGIQCFTGSQLVLV